MHFDPDNTYAKRAGRALRRKPKAPVKYGRLIHPGGRSVEIQAAHVEWLDWVSGACEMRLRAEAKDYTAAAERSRMPDGSISASRFIAECDKEDKR